MRSTAIFPLLLAAIALAQVPSAKGPSGDNVDITSFNVGTFTSGGSQLAYLAYPTRYQEFADGSMPLVILAHGMTAGCSRVLDSYDNLMKNISSWDMIVIAPAPCCLLWCTSYPDDIYRGITDTKGKHPILAKADYTNVGLIGHSMGGNAVMKIAADP